MLTSREEYIKKGFFSDLTSKEGNELVKKISDIGNSIGYIGGNANQNDDKAEKRKHKYDVWIAKEVKNDRNVIDKVMELRLIVDWASDTNADIFKLNFNSAYQAQVEWHEEMRRKYQIEKMNIPNLDENRIIFRFSDKEHLPHVTIEVDVKSRKTIQKFGKSNPPPVEKYKQMYGEYALYASDFKNLHNKEVLKFLNINFITKNT